MGGKSDATGAGTSITVVAILGFSMLALPAIAKLTNGHHAVPRTESAVRVDAILDDDAWTGALRLELPYETSPLENTEAPARTEMLLTHDERRLYAAFIAHDPNPKAIRAHYTDRDSAFNDDFVGIVIDTFNDERRAYEFFVNPLGVQMDLIQDDVSGNEDSSWDTIWDSAGRLTDSGYVVEMSVPFDSLRFPKSDGELTWGLDALRIYPRDQRRRLGLNKQDRNRNCYLCQASKITGFSGISPGRNLEFAPTVTAARTQARFDMSDPGLDDEDSDGDAGLTVRWGITPNMTLNGTVNPDFSQVEADVAQLAVNERFALFFPEKRPFFLEGADLFETPFNSVFTRSVADPDVGLKLTGKQGKNAIGVISTRDSINNLIFPGSQSSDQTTIDDEVYSTVVRYRRDVGESSAVGLLLTDRQGDDYHNRQFGIDAQWKATKTDRFAFQYVHSDTSYPDDVAEEFDQPTGSFGGDSVLVRYDHNARNWRWNARYVDQGEDFRADTGFMPQVDKRFYLAGLNRRWWGDKDSWWSFISLGGDIDLTTDHHGQELEREAEFWFNLNGPLQSNIEFGGGLRERFFNGTTFDEDFEWLFLSLRPNATVRPALFMRFGSDIDFANTRAGEQLILEPSLTLRLGKHLETEIDYTYRSLDVDGGRLFTANLAQVQAVYQFNRRMFVRAITQFRNVERDPSLYDDPVDSKSERWFNQLLFSYKLNPQTVLFLGYADNHAGDQEFDLRQQDRTVFFKIGYAWRP